MQAAAIVRFALALPGLQVAAGKNIFNLHFRIFLFLIFIKFFQESNFEKENKKRVRLLMTKLDKMTTKRNTASFLKNTYHKTVGKLKKDALTMHKDRGKIEKKSCQNFLLKITLEHGNKAPK